jgi:hypothetical protein
MLYYILAFLIFVFAVYDISIERKSFHELSITSYLIYSNLMLLLIVLGGIRWRNGTDWKSYFNYFAVHKTWDEYNDGQFEILYAFLNFFARKFFNSYTAFLLIFTSFVISLKFYTFRKISLYPVLSLFLFFCNSIGDIFAVRQALAISILWISIYFIHKKNILVFIIITIIAASIHNTAIVWIFSYSIYHRHYRRSIFVYFFLILLVIGLFGTSLYTPLIDMLIKPLSSDARVITKLIIYSDSAVHYFSDVRLIIQLGRRFLFIPVFLIFRNKLSNTNKYIAGLLNLYFWGNIVSLLFVKSFTEIQRAGAPYVQLEFFILPAVLKIIKKKYIKYLFLIFILVYGCLKLYSTIIRYMDLYIPYYSIFNNVQRDI